MEDKNVKTDGFSRKRRITVTLAAVAVTVLSMICIVVFGEQAVANISVGAALIKYQLYWAVQYILLIVFTLGTQLSFFSFLSFLLEEGDRKRKQQL